MDSPRPSTTDSTEPAPEADSAPEAETDSGSDSAAAPASDSGSDPAAAPDSIHSSTGEPDLASLARRLRGEPEPGAPSTSPTSRRNVQAITIAVLFIVMLVLMRLLAPGD
ncbi:MAG: hypothetical protein IT372_35685 [Polyangiaceae bacterium]|nr:hypothetical protein [Polyangiaceae bacterium]